MSAVRANTKATKLLKEGDAAGALEILDRALLDQDLSTTARSTLLANRGLCLEQVGRFDESVAALEAATSESKNDELLILLREMKASQVMGKGMEKATRNDYAGALALFEEAGRLDPEDEAWRYNGAVMLHKLGRTEEALGVLQKSKVIEEETLPFLGELLCKRQRWRDAVETIDKAIADGLELPASLLFNYGVARLKLGDAVKAREAFQDVISYYPNYGLAYDALASIDAQEGAALCQQKNFDEAIPKLYAAVKRTPKASTLYNLALALLKERRAPEAKDQFAQLLKMDPRNANAQAGLEAAELMIQGGNFHDAPPEQDDGVAAPQKRIYEIASEKGVGNLASQDDMVQLLSGIEEWVLSALGPLEQRVIALEQAADAAGGIVGSASEDRAVLQMLFDRVAAVEEQSSSTTVFDDGTVADIAGVTPDLAARFDTAALSRKLTTVTSSADGLNRRLQAVEQLILGNAVPKKTPRLDGLLGERGDDDDDGAVAASTTSSQMSVVARLTIQEQRFAKMSAEMEQQAKEIQRLKAMVAAQGGGGRPFFGGGASGSGTPVMTRTSKKQTGAKVGAMDTNILEELKGATKRRAAKRRELGLTIME